MYTPSFKFVPQKLDSKDPRDKEGWKEEKKKERKKVTKTIGCNLNISLHMARILWHKNGVIVNVILSNQTTLLVLKLLNYRDLHKPFKKYANSVTMNPVKVTYWHLTFETSWFLQNIGKIFTSAYKHNTNLSKPHNFKNSVDIYLHSVLCPVPCSKSGSMKSRGSWQQSVTS